MEKINAWGRQVMGYFFASLASVAREKCVSRKLAKDAK